MDGFIFFLIFIFIIVPIFKNIVSGKSAKKSSRTNKSSTAGQKNWTQVQKLLQEQMKAQNKNNSFGKKGRNQRDKHGHSNARRQTHDRMHSRDGNTDVFPESHRAHVQKRDARSRKDRQRIETMIHSKQNQTIHREGNQGVDNWGARGDNSHIGRFLFLLLFGLIALLVIANIAPELWQEITQILNIK